MPGSAVGEKGKKRGQIGKISASEASRAEAWGGERAGGGTSSQTTSRLASLAPNAKPGPRLGFC